MSLFDSFDNPSFLRNGSKALRTAFLCALTAAGASATAHATSLVVDGNFSQITLISGKTDSTFPSGRLDSLVDAAGWTTTGYNFVFTPGTGDTTGMSTGSSSVKLWGLQNGAGSAQSASGNYLDMTTPFTGNIVAADGAYDVGALTQSISNLVAGDVYAVNFWFAGAQQSGYTGATTEQWKVSLGGGPVQSTQVLDNVNHGFTGWYNQTFDFTATSTTETLSFLAAGTPNGEPPFSLLGGITMDVAPTPEMGSLGLLFTGISSSAAVLRYRRRKTTNTVL